MPRLLQTLRKELLASLGVRWMVQGRHRPGQVDKQPRCRLPARVGCTEALGNVETPDFASFTQRTHSYRNLPG